MLDEGDGTRQIDLGCYQSRDLAAVAHDVIALFSQHEKQGGRNASRLPPMDGTTLLLDYTKYERHSRFILGKLELGEAPLASALKSQSLAEQVLKIIAPPAEAPDAAAGQQGRSSELTNKRQLEHATEGSGWDGERPAKRVNDGKRPAAPKAAQNESPEHQRLKTHSSGDTRVKAGPGGGTTGEAGRLQALARVPEGTAEGGTGGDVDPAARLRPFHAWLRADFPPGSGQFPMLVKEGPLDKGFCTLPLGMARALLEGAKHGPLTLVDAEDEERRWQVRYVIKNLKDRDVEEVSGTVKVSMLASVLWGKVMHVRAAMGCRGGRDR